jgi:ABC-type branched-subunit amino acid transport system permease subunit
MMSLRPFGEAAMTALALVAFAALPLLVPDWVAADFSIYFAYAILAASLSFLWGRAGILSLGHAVYFGIGAYAMSLVTMGMVPGLPDLRSSWIGLVAAMAASGATAVLLGWFFFARRGLRGAFLGVVTLALAVVAERLAVNSDTLGGMNGLMNVPPLMLGFNGEGFALTDTLPLYYGMLGLLSAVLVGLLALGMSRFGTVVAAVRDNELRAWSLGHDVRRIKVVALGLSGALAGLAGGLFVAQFGFASPSLIGFGLSADALIWVALGGRAFPVAAALGAIAVRLAESRFSGPLGQVWPLALGLLFMASVLAFPDGLFGALIRRVDRGARRQAVIHEA